MGSWWGFPWKEICSWKYWFWYFPISGFLNKYWILFVVFFILNIPWENYGFSCVSSFREFYFVLRYFVLIDLSVISIFTEIVHGLIIIYDVLYLFHQKHLYATLSPNYWSKVPYFRYYQILLAAHLHWFPHLVLMIRVLFTTHSNIYDGAFLKK